MQMTLRQRLSMPLEMVRVLTSLWDVHTLYLPRHVASRVKEATISEPSLAANAVRGAGEPRRSNHRACFDHMVQPLAAATRSAPPMLCKPCCSR